MIMSRSGTPTWEDSQVWGFPHRPLSFLPSLSLFKKKNQIHIQKKNKEENFLTNLSILGIEWSENLLECII